MTRRFLIALFIAAIYKAGWRNPWRLLKPIWSIFLSFLPFKKASPEVAKKRLEACKNCCYFVPLLQTCGSPLSEYPDEGCGCFLPQKVKDKDATCWADDELGASAPASCGWKRLGL